MTFDEIRAIALRWPEVEEGTSYGTPALKVRKKMLVRLKEDGDSFVMPGVPRDERDLDGLAVQSCTETPTTLANLLDETFTDGFLVLKDGTIRTERYFNGMTERSLHLSQSMAKSVT